MVRGLLPVASLLLAASLLAGLTACGRGYCERSARAIEDCGSDAGFWLDQCRQDLKSCTKADEKRLEAFFECREEAGVYACERDDAALEAALVCLAELDGVSEGCVFDEVSAADAQ